MMIEIALSIVFPVCLVVILIGCLDCLFKKRRLQGARTQEATNGRHSTSFAVDICDIPHTSEQVTIEPLPDILSKIIQPLRPQITSLGKVQQDASGSFASVQRSFPRDHLTYLNEIGSGWFGKAIESEAVQMMGGSYASHVVVKMLKDDASKLEQMQFLDEVCAFRNLENSNLMSFIGQCTETNPFLVVLEFATHGNLKSFLVQNNQKVNEMVAKNRFLSFALDAASGLACLHKHDYVHNDLAARNCLVMSDYTLKIGDYGISDHLFKNEYYNTGTQLLPIRWMAPETLTKSDGAWAARSLDKRSDIWSFGILLWEICSVGEVPYSMLNDEAVLQGVIMDRVVLPSDGNLRLPNKDGIWSVMVRCWRDSPKRQTVEEVYNILEQLNRIRVDTLQDFDQKWNQLKQNQGRTLSSNTDLGSRIALAGSFVTDGSPTSSEKSSPLDGEMGTLDGSRSDDIFIEIVADSSKTASNQAVQSEPTILKQNGHIEENLGKFEHDEGFISKHQVVVHVENELVRTSASSSYQNPIKPSELNTPTIMSPAVEDKSSASQSILPESSKSKQYKVPKETLIQPENQNENLIDVSLTGADNFLPITAKTSPELLNENVEKPIKENDEISKSASFNWGEDDDFSEFVRTSPTAPSVDFTDFASAGNDLAVKVELQDKLKTENDTSLKTSSLVTEDVDSAAANSFSEFPVATGDKNTAISDEGIFSDFVVSAPQTEAERYPVTKEVLNLIKSNDSHAELVESFIGKGIPLSLETEPMSSSLSTFSHPAFESHKPNVNISTHEPDLEQSPQPSGVALGVENLHTNQPMEADIFLQKVSTEKAGPDQNQNIFSFEQVSSNISSLPSNESLLIQDLNRETVVETPSNKVECFPDLLEHSVDVTSMEPMHAHAPSITDLMEESNTEIFQALDDGSSPFNSVDILEQSFQPQDSITDETAIHGGVWEQDQKKTKEERE